MFDFVNGLGAVELAIILFVPMVVALAILVTWGRGNVPDDRPDPGIGATGPRVGDRRRVRRMGDAGSAGDTYVPGPWSYTSGTGFADCGSGHGSCAHGGSDGGSCGGSDGGGGGGGD